MPNEPLALAALTGTGAIIFASLAVKYTIEKIWTWADVAFVALLSAVLTLVTLFLVYLI